jgi:hypothetical protein
VKTKNKKVHSASGLQWWRCSGVVFSTAAAVEVAVAEPMVGVVAFEVVKCRDFAKVVLSLFLCATTAVEQT